MAKVEKYLEIGIYDGMVYSIGSYLAGSEGVIDRAGEDEFNKQGNPFVFADFTPDGRLAYLYQPMSRGHLRVISDLEFLKAHNIPVLEVYDRVVFIDDITKKVYATLYNVNLYEAYETLIDIVSDWKKYGVGE